MFTRKSEKETSEKPSPSALDNAWKIHEAQGNWTSRVDAKAAFAFTIQSAAIATAISLSTKVESHSSSPSERVLFAAGIVSLVIGAIFAALAVLPRLRQRSLSDEVSNNFIYFGHARRWDPEKLEVELKKADLLPQLSRQIVATAEIAWRKHMLVKRSFYFAIFGLISLTTSALISFVA